MPSDNISAGNVSGRVFSAVLETEIVDWKHLDNVCTVSGRPQEVPGHHDDAQHILNNTIMTIHSQGPRMGGS